MRRYLQPGWVIGGRREYCRRDDERKTETEQAIAQELRASLSSEALPEEESGEKKHERHEEDFVETGEDGLVAPPCVIDDGKG
jgi:hypothetical protein